MECVNYRVYGNFRGWELLAVKKELPKVVTVIENKMKEEERIHYLIIEHDYVQDIDNPYRSIYSVEDFLLFKEEVSSVSARIENVHTKQKQLSRGR